MAMRIGGAADSTNSKRRPLAQGSASFFAAAAVPPVRLLFGIFLALTIQTETAESSPGNAAARDNKITQVSQTRTAELIAPKSKTISYQDVFFGKSGPGETFTAHSGSTNTRNRVFEGDSSPFGTKASYIPFWQLAQLYRETENEFAGRPQSSAERGIPFSAAAGLTQGEGTNIGGHSDRETYQNSALIGKGSIYLPAGYSPQERSVSRLILEDLRNRNVYPETFRLEIDIQAIPGRRFEGRDLDAMSVKEIGKNGRSVRYGIFFPSQEFPAAVISAGISCYVPAYRVSRQIEEGRPLEPDDLRLTGVLREDAGRNLLDPKFTSGYRYETRRRVDAGEALRAALVREIAPVGRGENVTCLFRRGSVRLEVKGRSLSEGGVGDIVRVRLSTGKIIESTVVDRAVVEAGG